MSRNFLFLGGAVFCHVVCSLANVLVGMILEEGEEDGDGGIE
jgi:hypothetical protein